MYFDKQFKRKNPTTAKQLGLYAWNAQNATDHGIILKRKNPTTAKQLGLYAWVSPKRNGSWNNP